MGNLQETSRASPYTVDSSNNATVTVSGNPLIVLEVLTSSDLKFTIQADFGSGTFISVPCSTLGGARVSAGTVITASVNQVVFVPSVGAQFIRVAHSSGSGTVNSTSHATDAINSFLLDKISGGINAIDSASVDAFGRWRVSNPETIFDSKLVNIDDAPLFWDEQLESGSGITASTPTANKPYIDFASTDTTAGVMTRQTFRRFNYQPGKSQLILMTGVLNLSGGGAGVERRIGAFDDDNGAFFEDDSGTVGVTVRTNDSGSPVDATVAQSGWDDPMDGSGASGITIDWTKAQIFIIDFQWLSAGRVRFGLEIGGLTTYVHEVNHANASAIPWCSNPCLPLRYQMVTTSSSPASTMRCICSAVISEGGTDDVGVLRHNSTAGTQVDMDTEGTLYAIKGLRLKATHLGATVKIVKVEVSLQSASDDIEWILVFNPAIAGSRTWVAQANSSVETLSGAAGNTVTGGTHIDSGYVSTGAGAAASGGNETTVPNALLLGAAIDGTVQTIVLCARPINGSATDVRAEGGITWRELT